MVWGGHKAGAICCEDEKLCAEEIPKFWSKYSQRQDIASKKHEKVNGVRPVKKWFQKHKTTGSKGHHYVKLHDSKRWKD